MATIWSVQTAVSLCNRHTSSIQGGTVHLYRVTGHVYTGGTLLLYGGTHRLYWGHLHSYLGGHGSLILGMEGQFIFGGTDCIY
jgi:hypothetical protein